MVMFSELVGVRRRASSGGKIRKEGAGGPGLGCWVLGSGSGF